jgi:glycosyltransferase involved in cell wall biosynthesis
MQIGFFADSYFPRKDGFSYTLKSWKNRLEDRGHEVHLWYPESSHEPGENEHPVTSARNPFYTGHSAPLAVPKPEVDLDVGHVHSPGPVGLAGRDRISSDTGSVFSYHTPVEDYAKEFGPADIGRAAAPLVSRYEGWFISGFDIITSSTSAIPHDTGYKELPVGVDTEFFNPKETDSEAVIGYAGRISEEKNLGDVVGLAKRTEHETRIVGEGRHRSRLEDRAPENVDFEDFLPREELPGFLSGIDVYCIGSESDTFCLASLEANLCGTPVLAPKVPPFTETIHSEQGALYNPGDLDDMEQKLEKLLDTELNPRSEASRYSLENTIDRLEKLYRQVA